MGGGLHRTTHEESRRGGARATAPTWCPLGQAPGLVETPAGLSTGWPSGHRWRPRWRPGPWATPGATPDEGPPGPVEPLRRLAHAECPGEPAPPRRLRPTVAGGTGRRERTAFFPTIRLTLNHILIVDWYYMDALEGGEAGYDLRDEDEPFTELPALAAAQAAADRRLVAFCDTLTPEAAGRAATLVRPTGRFRRAGGLDPAAPVPPPGASPGAGARDAQRHLGAAAAARRIPADPGRTRLGGGGRGARLAAGGDVRGTRTAAFTQGIRLRARRGGHAA